MAHRQQTTAGVKNAKSPRKTAERSDEARPEQPSSNDQSGSAGRRTADGGQAQGTDTGQGRYGQSGYAGGPEKETIGQSKYRRSENDGDSASKSKSNPGSGRADPDESKQSGLKKP